MLAKVAKAEFQFLARPGDTLVYRAKIEDLKEGGAFTVVTSHVGERLQGEAEIFFAHLDRGATAPRMFEPQAINDWLQALRMFEVARDAAGNPLSNEKLIAACRATGSLNGAV